MRRPTVCPACGEPLEPDDRFCGACGTELTSAEHEPTRSRLKERKRWLSSPSRTCRSSPSTSTRTSSFRRAAVRSTRSSP
ncbi:zinc ribbon domain-containing protein [Streptomyces sp. cg40]|uniref:zinc ribbon domain-containing protein n=1 Tax=Streptomyces sp. cg40 TaxID=3419764 RepID=UPI003CFDAF20